MTFVPTKEQDYKRLAQGLLGQLSEKLGKEKYQEWREEQLISLRGKVELTQKDLYIAAKDELANLQAINRMMTAAFDEDDKEQEYIKYRPEYDERLAQAREVNILRHGG